MLCVCGIIELINHKDLLLNMDKPRISPELKKRNPRLRATIAMASLAILSACGGGASAEKDKAPVPIEASPSETPNPETVQSDGSTPLSTEAEEQPSEVVASDDELPGSTPENTEEPGGETGEELVEECDDLHCPGVFHTPEFPSNSENILDAENAQRVIDALFENINFGINNNSPIHVKNSIGPDASGFLGTALETMDAVNQYHTDYPDTDVAEVYRIQAEVLGDPIQSPTGYAVEVQEYEDRDPLTDELIPLGEPFKVVLSRVDITYNSSDTETSVMPSWVFNGNIQN